MPDELPTGRAAVSWPQRYLLVAILLLACIFWTSAKLGIVLFVAILATLLILPLRNLYERRFSRGVASLLAIVTALAGATAFFVWIVRTIVPGFSLFVYHLPQLIRPDYILSFVETFNLPAEITEYIEGVLSRASYFAVNIAKQSVNPLVQALSGIVELVAVPFIVFYFLKDGRRLCDMAFSYAPQGERPILLRLSCEIGDVLGGYMKGQLTVCLFSGAAVFCYFQLTGLPYGPVFAALAALGELVPIVGPLTAAAMVVGLCLGQSVAFAVKTVVFYTVLLKINHNLVSPNLIGRAVNVHPVLIMVGILFFGHLFGILGMVMAVPVMGVGRLVLREFLPQYE